MELAARAIRFEDWRRVVDRGESIQCGACVVGCLLRALKLAER